MLRITVSDIQGICEAVHESHKQFEVIELLEVKGGGCVVSIQDIPGIDLRTVQGWIRRAGGICHYVTREYSFDRWILRTHIK